MRGMDIIEGKGSTEFGIGTALADMAKAVLMDEHRILPASTLLEGEYGQTNVHAGVPCIIGRKGIEQVVELKLTDEELKQFENSCNVIKQHMVDNLKFLFSPLIRKNSIANTSILSFCSAVYCKTKIKTR